MPMWCTRPGSGRFSRSADRQPDTPQFPPMIGPSPPTHGMHPTSTAARRMRRRRALRIILAAGSWGGGSIPRCIHDLSPHPATAPLPKTFNCLHASLRQARQLCLAHLNNPPAHKAQFSQNAHFTHDALATRTCSRPTRRRGTRRVPGHQSDTRLASSRAAGSGRKRERMRAARRII